MDKQRKERQRCAGLTIKELEWRDRKNVMRRLARQLKRLGYQGAELDKRMEEARDACYLSVVDSLTR